ncbi:DUF5655 domain-containing protein [Anaerofustis stercorihominis]|uniref:DUF5655 domain-containing protein n=1 Tax=Anaerofustis stercorihominis TaxID=214853 RepID=UPI003BFA76D8
MSPILENDIKEGQVSKETKIFSEDDLLIDIPDTILDIYNELKEYILSLDDNINLNPTKLYIGFNRGRKSVISIKIQKSSLVLWINSNLKEINAPKNIIRDVSNIGHHGNGNCEIKIYDRKNIGYIEDILKEYIYNLD